MAVGCGLYFNKSWFALFEGLMEGISYSTNYKIFAAIAFALQLLATILMIIIIMKRQKKKGRAATAWAAKSPIETDASEKNVNFMACLTVIISPLLCIAFNVQVIPSILIAVI